jgi:hypothetical protein
MISSKNKSYNNELIKSTTNLDERKSPKKNLLQLFNLALKGK